jgi:glycerol-3-phosphate acyltransferase PlsY
MGSPWAEILAALLAFAIGGIPFGWVLARLFKGVDLRKVGSGNIGATNASRIFSKGWSIVSFVGVFALDFAKGFCAAYFSYELALWLGAQPAAQTVALVCGSAAILGHVFSPWLGFKGGKGVATALGVVTALAPWSALASVGAWGLLVGLTGYVSLGSIGAMLVMPVFYFVNYGDDAFRSRLAIFLFLVALAGVVIWRHRTNIGRILKGRERKVGTQKREA